MSTVVASVGIGLTVLLNLVATVMLVRSDFETPLQRAIQLAFIWVVPFVGTIIVIAILRGARADIKTGGDSNLSDAFRSLGGPESDTFSDHHGGHGGGDAG